MEIDLTGSKGFVLKSFLNYCKSIPNFKLSCLNLRDPSILNNYLKSDICIHLAGLAHDLKRVNDSHSYYKINTELTIKLFDLFLKSSCSTFIYISSVKAVSDFNCGVLFEDASPNPLTHYGKSKLYAEQYILSKMIPDGKRVYILRPCMIYGRGNKGNLNLLYSLVSKGFPWPLGLFNNSRSYLSVENLCFIIRELIERRDIPSGVYNVADDVPLSTNEVINLIAESMGETPRIYNINKTFISVVARLGDLLKFPLNSERLQKLTDSYVISNAKIKAAIGKPLPVSSRDGLLSTFKSFSLK